MPDFNEILRSLRGSWRLLFRDEGGYNDFTMTIAGFWRSFAVILLVLPLYFVAFMSEDEMVKAAGQDSGIITRDIPYAIAALGVVIEWFAYPAIMVLLARIFNFSPRYVPYIIAYNWTALLIMLLMMPTFILFNLGVLNAGAALGLNFSLTIIALYFRWYVAVTALKTTPSLASAFVAIDFLISLLVNFSIHSIV